MSRQSSAAKAGRASGEVRAVDATERHADWMDQAKQISRRNKHKSPNAIAKQIANLAAENAGLTGEKPLLGTPSPALSGPTCVPLSKTISRIIYSLLIR